MIKGLYAAASAMLAGMSRQQVLAHNASNLETPGFKEILTSLTDFDRTSVEFAPGDLLHAGLVNPVGDHGLGVMTGQEMVNFDQGGLKETGYELDLAIDGDGFFRIRTPDGERYTRDGRFLRDPEGNLTTVEGFLVLDDGGQPIQLEEGRVAIFPDGMITVDGNEAGQIGLAVFEDPAVNLVRAENNTFSSTAAPTGEGAGSIQQGYLEMSNASPARLTTEMVSLARAYEAAQRVVQTQDELLGQTISSLGRLG